MHGASNNGKPLRKRIKDIRRQELAEATLLTLQEFGVNGTTVQRVSERAGMSHGLVHHYFRTKADLLEAGVRLTNARITAEVLALLERAKTPRQRIAAVIEGNFAPSLFTREIAQAWASCSGEAAFNEGFARVMRMIYRRLMSNLLWDLKKVLPPQEAVVVAQGVAMMIDGAWLRRALESGRFTREQAMKPIWIFLEANLPKEAGE